MLARAVGFAIEGISEGAVVVRRLATRSTWGIIPTRRISGTSSVERAYDTPVTSRKSAEATATHFARPRTGGAGTRVVASLARRIEDERGMAGGGGMRIAGF